MGNIVTDYRTARGFLRLGKYETWLVECIVALLGRHDQRVREEQRLRSGQAISPAAPRRDFLRSFAGAHATK